MSLENNSTVNHSTIIGYATVAYGFVLPLSRAGISFFTLLLVLLWIIEGDFKNKIKLLLINPTVLAILAFILMNFISLLWADDTYGSLAYIRRYWYLLPVFVLFTSLKKEYVQYVLSAFILGMLISEVISYGVFFELWTFKYATIDNPSPFMHHIEYSIFLAFTALILLSRILNAQQLKSKILYGFFFLTMSGNLFLTNGRTGQIAFFVGLFVLILLNFKNKFKALTIALLLSVSLIFVAWNFSATFKTRILMAKNNIVHVVEYANYCTSLGARIGAYIAGKDIVLNYPILGAGLTDNMTVLREYIDKDYPEMECVKVLPHIHNQYLQIVTQMGLVGLFFFLAIFYKVSKIPLKKSEYIHMKYIYITVLSLAFMVEVAFHRAFSLVLFSLVVGLLLAYSRRENEI